MKIDHIGYAVKRIDRAVKAFESVGFSFGPERADTDRNVKFAFGEKDLYRIELVCPLDKSKPSPVDLYLRNVSGMPYHICYQSENLDTEVERMIKQGFKVVIEPRPAIAFDGRHVVFLLSHAFGLLEIVEV